MTKEEKATATEKACYQANVVAKAERIIRSASTRRERDGFNKIAAEHRVSVDHIKRLVTGGK